MVINIKHFTSIETLNQLATFLSTTPERLRLKTNKRFTHLSYKRFEIPKKSGGTRVINSPTGEIEKFQITLKPFLEAMYRNKNCSHGFIKNRSIVTNALQHTGQKYVLNVDLQDFFRSIHFGRIFGLFQSPPFNFPRQIAVCLANICTLNNEGLPQGSPISPVLSNFIASRLDRELTHLAKRYRLYYTRYADDLTFSTWQNNFPKKIAHLSDETSPIWVPGRDLSVIIEKNNFRINPKKFRMQTKDSRQEVTGITVNKFPNIRRKFIRKIRAMLHSWKTLGIEAAEIIHFSKPENQIKFDYIIGDGEAFKKRIYGYLAFVRMVRGKGDRIYLNFCKIVNQLDQQPYNFIQEDLEMSNEYDVFICHASEDKPLIAQPIFKECSKLGIKPFLDEEYIRWGDSFIEKINDALRSSKYFLAILSTNSVDKSWPRKELHAALAKDIGSNQKRILPLKVGDPNIEKQTLLADIHYLEWDSNPEEIAQELFKILNPKKS